MPSTTSAEVSPDRLEEYRRELTGYCYRMLGSGFEADDAVQETMLRAWRAADGFEGRSSVRSWLYRIATNICLDMLRGRQRRALPMDLGPASPPVEALARRLASGRRLDLADRRRAGAARARRPGRHRGGPGHDQAGVRDRAAAPAGPAAGHADPVRGAAHARRGGGRHARHQRARGEQRAAAGPGHAGRAARGPAPGGGRGRPGRPAGQVRGRVPGLRPGSAGHAAARGRGDDHAAVHACG